MDEPFIYNFKPLDACGQKNWRRSKEALHMQTSRVDYRRIRDTPLSSSCHSIELNG